MKDEIRGDTMKRTIYPAVALFMLLLVGCNGIGIRGSGIVKDENRPVDSFDNIDISGMYDVRISVGNENSLRIYGDDNLLPLIKTEVEGNTLHVWSKKNISPRKKIKIEIVTESLETISSSGASRIKLNDFKGEELNIEGSGAGSFHLSGETEYLRIELSGAVNLNADNLIADKVDVEISGASDADVYAKDELRAEISGVGNIEYSGNPQSVKKSISGLGSITQK